MTGPGPAGDLDWLLAPADPPDAAGATPVSVLTGFLSAGKTTLVNRILSEVHGLRIAVTVNDFGAVAIDSELIIGVEPGTISLANGCVCCEIRGDLVAAVDSILGQDRDLDALVLEASGVAEPSGIARTFTSEVFRSPIRLDGIVAVIDAEQLPAQAQDPATRDLVFGQIGYSNIVLLNKIDLAERARVDAVRTFVHDRLPTVRIIETSRAQVPFHLLLGTGPAETAETPGRGTDGGHRDRSGAFQQWTYTRDGAVDVDALLASIRLLPARSTGSRGSCTTPAIPATGTCSRQSDNEARLTGSASGPAGPPAPNSSSSPADPASTAQPSTDSSTRVSSISRTAVRETSNRPPVRGAPGCCRSALFLAGFVVVL